MEEKLVKSQKRKPLGKGLNSLLGLNDDIRINEHNSATPVSNRVASESVIYISPDKIKKEILISLAFILSKRNFSLWRTV